MTHLYHYLTKFFCTVTYHDLSYLYINLTFNKTNDLIDLIHLSIFYFTLKL